MHDFDLAFNFKLLKKIGQLKKLTVFGVPVKINKKTALKQLAELTNNPSASKRNI